ncbi:Mobile element protein [Methanosarcina lacustris Z-7289]|uniref:Mobile element protein n=1 Tax=Methanosarcina lacustris Z-7289 TaxID=1434111 RepID=A0A0E3S4W8_9EURY|nr:Mobile element protein [Methanosarcina lacustris Z-7289]
MKQITGNFLKSNNASVEKYVSEKHLEFNFQTRTRSAVSTCIDYLNGLLLLPYWKNMRKMAIYCCKCSNNQSLRNGKNITSNIHFGNGFIDIAEDNIENKNSEIISSLFLSYFLSNSPWLSADLLKSVRTKAIKTIGKNGVLILDESGIKKSGNGSVGVSHQYCGNLGKRILGLEMIDNAHFEPLPI